MSKSVEIYFITWPDGKLFEGTQTSIHPNVAVNNALVTWLIPAFFKDLDLHPTYSPVRDGLWKAMERAGFKLHTLEVPSDVAQGISK